ncbi:MAG: ABC transporter substrate-binding protein [Beutenbergiaceae bacterium]
MVVTRRGIGLVVAGLALAVAVPACTDPTPGAPDAEVTIGLTYVPNVQFAPFYLAQQRGYFEDEGVAVTLRHHGESEDLFGAMAADLEQLVVAGGDEMLQAVSAGEDVVSVATLYQEYPVTLIVPDDSAVNSPSDLADMTIGIPGPFGETYFGLLAMLSANDLSRSDVTIESIGFTQQAALAAGHVDAVMGFVNNDVPQFQATGLPVRVVETGDLPLVGISLGTTSHMRNYQAETLSGVLRAVGRAIADISAEPDLAVDATEQQIPGTVTDDQRAIMTEVATATVALYGPTGDGWGEQDDQRWQAMASAMHDLGLLAGAVDAEVAYTNDFVAQ